MSPALAFLNFFSGPELILILAVALIFFGGEKMPEFARGLARVIREFKKAASEVESEFKRVMDEAEHGKPPPRPRITVAPPAHLPEAYSPDGPEAGGETPPPAGETEAPAPPDRTRPPPPPEHPL
ncbi:MAG TPA: twin-arginine translocase TatA/TatE family subunit [Opitutaceae bacterium]|nr:twin-arginine translocase TatA/TatE family subunit [Opitutaceae bacterium]